MANYKRLFLNGYSYYITMPEHLHMIISVSNAKDYPKIISSIKRYFSKNCPAKYYSHILQSHHREKAGYLPVWQKRFYEHTIRDEKDWINRVQYIHNNPVKHALINNIHDWKYSSLNFKNT